MAIDPEVIYSSNKKGSKINRYFPKWAIYSSVGVVIVVLVGLIKTLFPFIGMAFLLSFIWSQSTTQQRH